MPEQPRFLDPDPDPDPVLDLVLVLDLDPGPGPGPGPVLALALVLVLVLVPGLDPVLVPVLVLDRFLDLKYLGLFISLCRIKLNYHLPELRPRPVVESGEQQ